MKNISVCAALGVSGYVFINYLLMAGTRYLTEGFMLFMVSEVSVYHCGETEAEQRSSYHAIQDTDKGNTGEG